VILLVQGCRRRRDRRLGLFLLRRRLLLAIRRALGERRRRLTRLLEEPPPDDAGRAETKRPGDQDRRGAGDDYRHENPSRARLVRQTRRWSCGRERRRL